MAFSPENNPYMPGDPYSYDLKWVVDKINSWKSTKEAADQAVSIAQGSADDAYTSANKAEAWAIGIYEGEPVNPDQPQYNNYSKYWAETAENAAALVKDIFVTPEMFGALGDGVTDDTAAIQEAINTDKPVLLRPNKTYLITDSLLMSSYQIFKGAGYDSVIKTTDNIPAFLIDASGQNTKAYITIADLTIQGGGTGCGIEFRGDDIYCISDYNKVKGVNISGFEYGIKVSGRAIYCEYEFLSINGCDYGFYTATQQFNTNKFTQVQINGSNIKAAYFGVITAATDFIKENSFINCSFENTAKNAAKDGGGAFTIQNAVLNRIINCWFEGNFENTTYSNVTTDLLDNNCDILLTGTFNYYNTIDQCTFQRTGGCAIKINSTQAYSNKYGIFQFSDKCSYHLVSSASNCQATALKTNPYSTISSPDANMFISGSHDKDPIFYDCAKGYRWIASWETTTWIDGVSNRYVTREINADFTITEITGGPGCIITIACHDSAGTHTLTLPGALGTLTHGQKKTFMWLGYPTNGWVEI